MLKRLFAPMRTCAGGALPISTAVISARSPQLGSFAPTLQIHGGITQLLTTDFSRFLPESLTVPGSSDVFPPIDGIGRLPAPAQHPFNAATDRFATVHGIVLPPAPPTPRPTSRQLWIELELRLAQPALVGGIAYAGHPLLPYTIDDHGEVSSNAGLPREVRLSWSSGGFLDDDNAITSQAPSAHGGFHYLCSGPVRTDRVYVRFADFPRFIRSGTYRGGRFVDVEERFGVCVPFLYLFEHRDGTRFQPDVPGATLAAVKYAADGTRTAGDLMYITQTPEKRYFQLSGGSVFGQQRQYVSAGATMRERFTSTPLGHRDQLVLYVEQSDENERCLAGMKLTLAASVLPGLEAVPTLDVAVYEVDPRQGMPPIGKGSPTDDRFATRLYRAVLGSTGQHTLRFVRPTSARHLALVFGHPQPDSSGGYFNVSIEAIALQQSAHIAVVPRPSRTQTVGAMHYRLVGEHLLDDYSRIGDRAFSMSVERVVAGERKEVLFSAASLLDLVHEGSARVVANTRFHETVADTWRETTTTLEGSWDDHDSYAYTDGWNRAETGDGVKWQDPIPAPREFQAHAGPGFAAYGNSETRTRTKVIGQEGIFEIAEGFQEILNTLFPRIFPPAPWPGLPASELVRGTNRRGLNWENDIWRGQHVEYVGLMRHLSLPPWLAARVPAIQNISDGLREISSLLRAGQFPPTGPLPSLPGHMNPLFDLLGATELLNGTNVSLSVGASYVVGVNAGFSWAPILPTLGFSTSEGSQGSIAQQANDTGYSYAQHKTKGTSVGRTITRWDRSPMMKRRSERALDETSVRRQRRRGADVMWQGTYADVIVGKVPLGIVLPATAGRMFRTTDESIVVRLNGVRSDVAVEVWFETQEEWVRDDS